MCRMQIATMWMNYERLAHDVCEVSVGNATQEFRQVNISS